MTYRSSFSNSLRRMADRIDPANARPRPLRLKTEIAPEELAELAEKFEVSLQGQQPARRIP